MAKVIFITLCDKGALGVRYISSLLKEKGHKTSIVYFKEYNQTKKKDVERDLIYTYKNLKQVWHEGISDEGEDMIFAYPPKVTKIELDLLNALIKEEKPDIIGISLSTSYIPIADIITTRIKKEFQGLILWGGAGPSTNPEQMIAFCDVLAIGEAEYAIVELVDKIEKGEDYYHINNLWVKNNNSIVKNQINSLITKLDALPFPDFSFENKFLISNNRLIKNCRDINNFEGMYTIMTARGCPYSCSYCVNDYYRKLYKGETYVRRRSVSNVITELLEAKQKLNITYVTFYDEVFTFDKKWVKEFSEQYAQKINLPFWCNVHPILIDEEIVMQLKNAGVESVTLGIQSGSEQIVKNFYKRDVPNTTIIRAAELLHKHRVEYYVDIITESLFETEEDCKKTLGLLLALPRPFTIATLSKLSLFENTYIVELAKKHKLVKLDKSLFNFYNKLYLLTTFNYIPKKLIHQFSQSTYLKEHPQKLNLLFILHKQYNQTKNKIKKMIPQDIWVRLRKLIKISPWL